MAVVIARAASLEVKVQHRSTVTQDAVQVLSSKTGWTVIRAGMLGSCRNITFLYKIYVYIFKPALSNAMPITRTDIDPTRLRLAAGQAVGALKVLANTDRLLLLCQLSQGEMCVGELEEMLDIRQPTLSQQLGVLRGEGVVNSRRDGKYMYYSVADPKLMQVLEVLYRIYCPTE